jgi:hypothetical protein
VETIKKYKNIDEEGDPKKTDRTEEERMPKELSDE